MKPLEVIGLRRRCDRCYKRRMIFSVLVAGRLHRQWCYLCTPPLGLPVTRQKIGP